MECIKSLIENLVPNWVDKLATLIGLLTSLLTLFFTIRSFLNARRLNRLLDEDIKIILTCGAESKKLLPHTVKRRHFTRSEIQGILGNCYNDNKRYNISYFSKEDYSNLIRDIQNGNSDTLTIPIEEKEEYDKFIIN